MRKINYVFITMASVAFLLAGCSKVSYMESKDSSSEVSSMEDSGDASSSVEDSKGRTIYVQVAGAVASPGVYELLQGARCFEAIEMAGGLLEAADDSDLNQAMELTDGQKIYVYTKGERELLEAASADDGLVNINTATAEQLSSLPGIGMSKANMIVSYRQEHGMFTSIEDIMNVQGIKEGSFARIKDYIKV